MGEMTGVTIHGNALTLKGTSPRIGEKAPAFEVLDGDLNLVQSSSLSGKVVVWVSVPSLDTPVCDIESRRFDQKALDLGSQVQICVISMDLPFAQKRWCGAAETSRIKTFSDHKSASFGLAYGVLIEELRLLARAIFVVDREGILRYQQIVKELTQEPQYEEVLEAIKRWV